MTWKKVVFPIVLLGILFTITPVRHSLLNASLNGQGETALHPLVREGRLALADFLMDLGANPFRRDESGTTPVDFALARIGETYQWGVAHVRAGYDSYASAVEAIEKHDVHALEQLLTSETFYWYPVESDRGEQPLLSHAAIRAHCVDCLRILRQAGYDLSLRDGDARTAFEVALAHGNAQTIQFFMQAGALSDLSVASWEEPLLFLPVRAGNPAGIEALLKAGLSADVRDRHGLSALHVSICKGSDQECPAQERQAQVARLLIQAGADPDAKIECETPLNQAAYFGNLAVTEVLIEAGADLEAGCEGYPTPLMTAANQSRAQVVELLIEAGANVYYELDGGFTMLHAAVSCGGCISVEDGDPDACDQLKSVTAEKLIEAGLNVNAPTKYLPLAPRYSLVPGAVRDGVKMGTDHTALYRAAWSGLKQTSEVLLKAGADPGLQSAPCLSPLNAAVFYGKRDIVEMFLEAGADPNDNQACEYSTLGMLTVAPNLYWEDRKVDETSLVQIAELLLAHGANPHVIQPSGDKLVISAIKLGLYGVARTLVNAGADVSARSKHGKSALELAMHSWRTRVYSATDQEKESWLSLMRSLVKAGISVNEPFSDGATPLYVAKEMEWEEAVAWLLDNGARP